MRRYVQISGLIVLAVLAGGWGSVMAAILCPHLNGDAIRNGVLSSSLTERGCHSAKPVAESKPHCHNSNMEQEGMGEMEEAAPLPRGSGEGAWLGLVDDSLCTHCMGRSELSISSVLARQQPEPKRSVEPVVARAATPLVPAGPVNRLAVLYRQGAPPGLLPSKYLLGVLLI